MKGAGGDSLSRLPTTPKREESPRGEAERTSDRTSLILKKDHNNLALLASMKRKPKKNIAESPSASEQHLSKFLEDAHDSASPSPSHDKPEELGETVSSSDEDELSRSYTNATATAATDGGAQPPPVKSTSAAASAVASQDESSSHMGDTTETTGLARKNRAAIRSFYEGGAVALNPSQSFSAADTESSIGSFKGARPKRRAKGTDEDEDEEDDYLDDDGSSVSVSYDDSAASESSASRHESSRRSIARAGAGASASAAARKPRAAPPAAASSSSSSSSSAKRDSLREEKDELLDEIASLDMLIARGKRQLEPELEVVILRMELEAKERMWNCLRVAAAARK